jgi:Tol biopolymer transport system component
MAIAMLDLSNCSESQFFRFAATTDLEPRQVRWMPDGRGLVMSYRSIYMNHYQIGYLSYPVREFHKITNDLNDYLQISLSSDGRSLSALLSQEDDNIAIFPAGSRMSKADQVTVIPGIGFSWLGKDHMSVVENLAAERSITNVDLATKEKSVTFSSANVLPLDVNACTADTLVFTGFSKEDLKQSIYASDSRGGNLRRLTFGKGDERATCSPDGKWVMFFDFSERSIRKVPFEGGSSQALATREQRPMPSFATVPGRDEILVQVPLQSAWQFQFISIVTGQVTRRLPGAGMPQACAVGISPDGTVIDFVPCNGASDIWTVPLAGGTVQQLTHLASRVEDPIAKFAWSPDGTRLAINRKPLKRDAVILQDVGK